MKISLYHHNTLYLSVKTLDQARYTLRVMLESNDIDPRDVEAAVISSPSERGKADLALYVLGTEIKSFAREYAKQTA